MTSQEPSHPPLSPEAKNYSTRRDFLLQVGIVINTIAAFMIGIPVIGFIVSSARLGDVAGIAGGVLFLAGCLVFIFPLLGR